MAAEPQPEANVTSLGLYFGILMDLVIDGVVIGIGSTVTLATGLLLAVGLAVSTAPLAFLTIATAKRQGMPPRASPPALDSCSSCAFWPAPCWATWSYAINRTGEARLLVALASGFLITMVTQTHDSRSQPGRRAESRRHLFTWEYCALSCGLFIVRAA